MMDPREFSKSLEAKYDAVVELWPTHGGQVELSAIHVPKGKRGLGIGTSILKEIERFADDNGLIVVLTPTKDFGATSVARLQRFYKQFGFVKNMGRAKDWRFRQAMIRYPVGYKR